MRKTYYHFVWSNLQLSDLVNVIENKKGYTDVVIFGPEEHNIGRIGTNKEQYILVKRFLEYHDVSLKIVLGSPKNSIENYRYNFKDVTELSPWHTYFSNYVLDYNLQKHITPYGHNNDIKKHFTSLNARSHPWRCMFVDYLYKYNLFDKGYVSWHNSENWNYNYKFKWWIPEKINFDKNWIENTTGILDILIPPEEQFKDSLFSIISESTTECIFVTEKTYIPIFHKRPFLIFGAPGIHNYLKSLGFKMFDQIIDYSFDSVDNDEKRCNLMMKQIKNLCNQDIQKIKKIVTPTVEYNFLNMLRLACNKKLIPKDVRNLIENSDHERMINYKNILNIGNSYDFINFIKKNNIDLRKKD